MKRRLNILHVIDSLSVGGAERLILGLAERVDRERFSIHLCCLGAQRGNALQASFERLGIPMHLVGSRNFYNPRALLAVGRYIQLHNIDIVHTHLTYADVVGRIVGRALGRPVVSTLQNVPRNYDRDRRDRSWLERQTARLLATRLVGVSPTIRDLFIREWGIPASRIDMFYNAVPMEQYISLPPEAGGAVDAGPVITNIGRLSPQKAQNLLLDAAKLVLARHPDARFMIVGQGRLEQPLKEQAQRLGISDNIIFTGLRHDIPALLGESDIFVLSSLWEGLPLTAVEAMAAARPVVLTDVGGNRDIVEDGVQGLIVPPNDVPALAEAILQLLDDPRRRIEMGLAGRARVRHDFNIDTIARQHEQLYESLVPALAKSVGAANGEAGR